MKKLKNKHKSDLSYSNFIRLLNLLPLCDRTMTQDGDDRCLVSA